MTAAKAHADCGRINGRKGIKLRVYRCTLCGQFHHTHLEEDPRSMGRYRRARARTERAESRRDAFFVVEATLCSQDEP